MTLRASALDRLAREIPDDAQVLDVGGWDTTFARADWVIDVLPYETRGRHGSQGEGPERFSAATWVQRDICDREPWPFEDKQFDFAVCGHTLEDVRDPIWVCSELVRVARAGYIEFPSRLEEQSYGFQGPWVGWDHHRWFVDIHDNRLEFVMKHHRVHGPEAHHFPRKYYWTLPEDAKARGFFWEGSFEYGERLMFERDEVGPYLAEFVTANRPGKPLRDRASRFLRRLANRIR
jgi:hypothetical protein